MGSEMCIRDSSESLERQQRKILKIIFGFDTSYKRALELAEIERLDVRRSDLRERFVIKLAKNPRFSEWLPCNETTVYSLRYVSKYTELPFRTERLRGAPLYSFRRILNFLESEKEMKKINAFLLFLFVPCFTVFLFFLIITLSHNSPFVSC